LHGADFGLNNLPVVRCIEKEKPDFIVVTGDMYTRDDKNGKKVAEKLLTKLAEKYTVYFVNGEHDNDEAFIKHLRENGVKVLNYLYEDIRIGKTEIRLHGINNVYYSPTFDLNNEFTLDESKYNILLAHICNKEKFASFGMDLCICGDTHGGQVRLPVIGGLYGTTGWLPEIRDENAFVKFYKYHTGKTPTMFRNRYFHTHINSH
jgi:predicted MPP superfamily phosphohydrolase